MDEYMENIENAEYHHHHHHRKRNPLRWLWDGIAQVFEWMWQDIRPSSSYHHHHHHRHNAFVRMLLGIGQIFSWMWEDIRPDNGVKVVHRSSLWQRMWRSFTSPFRSMAEDWRQNMHTDMPLSVKLKIFARMTYDNIRADMASAGRDTLLQVVSLALVILIAVRLLVVWYTSKNPAADSFYIYRHFIYSFVWCVLLFFFFNVYLLKKTVSPLIQNLIDMERVSFLAFIACLLKFATSVYYIIAVRLAQLAFNGVTAYYIGELAIWLLLAVFMFTYWRQRRKVRINTQKEGFER